MATYLTRERFKSLPRPKTQDVYVPDWDSTAHVRGLSAGIAMDLIATAGSGDPDDVLKVPGLITRIVMDAVVDDDGRRIFVESDYEELDGQPIQTLMPIVEAAIDLTNFGGNPAKNSGTGPSAGSSSDSPANSDAPSKT